MPYENASDFGTIFDLTATINYEWLHMERPPPKPRRRRSKSPRPLTGPMITPKPNEAEGLCGVAMLKIAMELKKQASAPIDEVIAKVLSKMAIEPGSFRKYLTSQGGVLQRLEGIRRGHRP